MTSTVTTGATGTTARPATQDDAHSPARKAVRPDRAAWGFLAPFLAFFVCTFLVPIGYAVYQSLLKVDRHGPLGLGKPTLGFAGLENYAVALGSPDFVDSFGRVLLFGIVTVPVMLILSTILALLLEHASRRWSGLLRASYFLPYGVPGVIASLLWSFLYVPGISPIIDLLGDAAPDFFGYNTVLWSIANIAIWEFAGYNMLIVVAQLKSIPHELIEAATIDGAGPWQIALRVKLPLVRPALILIAVFTIIGSMQLFVEPLILDLLSPALVDDYTPNLSAYHDAFNNANFYLAAAKSVILALVASALSFGFLTLVTRTQRSER